MHIPCRFRVLFHLSPPASQNSCQSDSNLNDHTLLTFADSRNKKREVALAHFERHR